MAAKRKTAGAAARKKTGAAKAANTARRAKPARKSTSRAKPKPRAQDAIALLKADHAEVDALFKKFEKGKDRMGAQEKGALARKICDALTIHAVIEEESFYPTVRPEIGDEDLMDEAEVEHQSLKELIAKIEAEGPSGEYFDAHVKVLGEYVKHHVKEEHEDMFPKVRKTDLDLKELGEKLRQR